MIFKIKNYIQRMSLWIKEKITCEQKKNLHIY